MASTPVEAAVKDNTSLTKEDVSAILLRAHPIGSIYATTESTNPSEIFGGIWIEWGSGQVPVGVNTSDADFNDVEKTGGAKSHSYTPAGTNSGGAVGNHTLTLAEIPSHSHSFSIVWSDSSGRTFNMGTGGSNNGSGTASTSNAGSNGAHNHPFTQPIFTGTASTQSHLQPYITCYMWKRIA